MYNDKKYNLLKRLWEKAVQIAIWIMLVAVSVKYISEIVLRSCRYVFI